jgi:hypothetical protein
MSGGSWVSWFGVGGGAGSVFSAVGLRGEPLSREAGKVAALTDVNARIRSRALVTRNRMAIGRWVVRLVGQVDSFSAHLLGRTVFL